MKILNSFRNFVWRASLKGHPKGPHITRYTMYKRLNLLSSILPIRTGRVLSISHSTNLVPLLALEPTEVVEANYPDHNMLNLGFPDSSFDIVLSDQVLEHIEGDPFDAVRECKRVLKPGGLVLHTTCFINPIHQDPRDFWRFTPDALSLMHSDFSQILTADSWGNFDAWSFINNGLRFVGVPHATWHPLHKAATTNDPLWPIVTWIAAVK